MPRNKDRNFFKGQDRPRLRISRKDITKNDLQWSSEEKEQLERRIVALREDQIGALIELVGLGFRKEDLAHIVEDIRADGLRSGHLEIVLAEALSKEELLRWVAYFEDFNRRALNR